jgi:hypothetical protein
MATTPTVLGLASFGIAAAPKPTNAWWHYNGYGLVRSGAYFGASDVGPRPTHYLAPCCAHAEPRRV